VAIVFILICCFFRFISIVSIIYPLSLDIPTLQDRCFRIPIHKIAPHSVAASDYVARGSFGTKKNHHNSDWGATPSSAVVRGGCMLAVSDAYRLLSRTNRQRLDLP
jgi:hypothetical protein